MKPILIITTCLIACIATGITGWFVRDYKFYRDYYETTQNAALPILGTDE